MDSAPGELEPEMVAASFRSVLTGSRASLEKRSLTRVFKRRRQNLRDFGKRVRERRGGGARLAPHREAPSIVDAAWGGFAAVTGNGWSGDRKSRPGNAAEVAHAVAEKKLRRLKAEAQQMRDEQTRGDARGDVRDVDAKRSGARASRDD